MTLQVCLTGCGGAFKNIGSNSFGKFDCQLYVDTEIIIPFVPITGTVVIKTTQDLHCYGIRVQLDATVDLRLEARLDNRSSTHTKVEQLLEGSVGRQQLSGIEDDKKLFKPTRITLPPGTHSYPFSIRMPTISLPSPFDNQFGSCTYKICIYIASHYSYIQFAEKSLRFRGYNNLISNNNYLQVRHESGLQKSIFSSKKVVKAILTLEKSGFLPGESAFFKLEIKNPKCFTVEKVTFNLNRRVTYNVTGATKRAFANLDSLEINETRRDEEVSWDGKLKVPKGCVPSFNVKSVSIYSVIHSVQYKVEIADQNLPIKGEVEIVIGTTKDSEDILMARRMSSLRVQEQSAPAPGPMGLGRMDSISSIRSDSSTYSGNSLPPPYSQLSTPRALSLNSIETLPPNYEVCSTLVQLSSLNSISK